jgi:hypothetical protein
VGLWCFLPIFLTGQTIQEFREIWMKESRESIIENQKPLPYLQSGIYFFSREQDNALSDVLDEVWEKYPVTPAIPVSKSKKFDLPPEFDYEQVSDHNPQLIPCYNADLFESSHKSVTVPLPRIRKPEYTTSNPLRQKFGYFGNPINISYDKLLSLNVNQQITKEIVASYWKKFVVSNSHHLVNQLMIYRDRLGLNDWGYLLLVKSCANAIFPYDDSGETLLSWALMVRSGYDVKLGFNQLGASLLFPSVHKIYGIASVKIGGKAYYIDNPISFFPITTYPFGHPGATRDINLKFFQSLNFQGEMEVKKLQFTWDKKNYEFNLRNNPEVIHFMESYPQTDPAIFFDAPFTSLAKESIFNQFKPILAGMKSEEGAAFLQQFVQKAFAWHPYNDLYGYDRFMFPEELLFKEESNDKGKALLYAWMITNLLNQKSALVEFPGFYSVAISLDHPMDGDNFLLNGEVYTIADPTYNNAPIGLIMKDFNSIKPLVRSLNSWIDLKVKQERIWSLAMAFGAERSGGDNDFLIDEDKNSYITGYFREKNTESSLPSPTPFVAKFDEKNVLVWMVKFDTGEQAFGLELKQLDRNEFYLAGSFKGYLECNGIKIQSHLSEPDLFFVQFNQMGTIGWMAKSGLDALDEETELFYVVKFSRSGDIQSVELANEDERNFTTGFQDASMEGLCYIASRHQTSGLGNTRASALVEPMVQFRQNLNRLTKIGTDPAVFFLITLFNSIKNSGEDLTGEEIALLAREKLFQNRSGTSVLNKISQKIKMINNTNDIIEISTVDSTPLKLGHFTISAESHMKIIPFDNNDLKIKIIDGIYYDSGYETVKVNTIILELSSGNMLLNLGYDHLLLSRNTRKDPN